jgi:hypothetical protein
LTEVWIIGFPRPEISLTVSEPDGASGRGNYNITRSTGLTASQSRVKIAQAGRDRVPGGWQHEAATGHLTDLMLGGMIPGECAGIIFKQRFIATENKTL